MSALKKAILKDTYKDVCSRQYKVHQSQLEGIGRNIWSSALSRGGTATLAQVVAHSFTLDQMCGSTICKNSKKKTSLQSSEMR